MFYAEFKQSCRAGCGKKQKKMGPAEVFFGKMDYTFRLIENMQRNITWNSFQSDTLLYFRTGNKD